MMKKRLIDCSKLRRPSDRVRNLAARERLPGARYELANKSGEVAELWLYGEIGPWDISAGDVARDLAKLDAKTVQVRLNSPGGDMWDGIAIYNSLARHKARVEVHVDALAASAASILAMAGDQIFMAENAQMMIHLPVTAMYGDADDFREMADLLRKCTDDQLIPTYVARTGQPADSVRKMMKAETWMNSQEAIDKGFADSIAPLSSAKAMAHPGQFAKLPGDLRARLSSVNRAGGPRMGAEASAAKTTAEVRRRQREILRTMD